MCVRSTQGGHGTCGRGCLADLLLVHTPQKRFAVTHPQLVLSILSRQAGRHSTPQLAGSHLECADAQVLPAVAARQVAQDVLVVVLEDAQDEVRGGHALGALRGLELAQPLDLLCGVLTNGVKHGCVVVCGVCCGAWCGVEEEARWIRQEGGVRLVGGRVLQLEQGQCAQGMGCSWEAAEVCCCRCCSKQGSAGQCS